MPDSTKQIKRVQDLPKSFCLGNYAGTVHLDARGWAEALSMRKWLQNLSIRVNPEPGVVTDEFIHKVFRDPLKQQAPPFEYTSFLDLDEPPLKHLTVRDLRLLSNFLLITKFDNEAKEVRKHFDDHMTDDKTTPKSLSKSAEEFALMAIDSMDAFPPRSNHLGYPMKARGLYLSVDMTCSDEELINEFTKILNVSRASREWETRPKNYSDKDFSRWCRNAVLPYIDLNLWAKANDTTITQHVMGDAIFPNCYFDRAQSIRQTVKPLALNLLRRETLKTLCAQGGKKKG